MRHEALPPPSGRLAPADLTSAGWRLCLTPPGTSLDPAAIPADADWVEARVPGTVAGALLDAGRLDLAEPLPIEDYDVWYQTEIEGTGAHTLRLCGLATIAAVFLDERPILSSSNMFHEHRLDLDLSGRHQLSIRFASLTAHLADPSRPKPKRARWRPRMIEPVGLNAIRTSILGHAPGWSPKLPIIGPWRAISLTAGDRLEPRSVLFRTLLEGSSGVVECTLDFCSAASVPEPGDLVCGDVRTPFERRESGDGNAFVFVARVVIPSPELWFPHTHRAQNGGQALHDVTWSRSSGPRLLGRVGFRSVEVDRGEDGKSFALLINGIRIFCRGACWTPVDLAHCPRDRRSYEPFLRRMVEAGMNMVRIGGTMVYEEPEFYALCDELGLLVWQDFMFANFDYPIADEAFGASVRLEARQFLTRTAASPSIVVLCGGSEVYQQAAMMGLPERSFRSALFDDLLPALCGELRPDAPYVDNSPSGGALPFFSDAGVAHYYGVGAYLRPLEDARRANMRFATECLAFANLPEEGRLARNGVDAWTSNVPRDAGAEWDFADVRDHYLALVYGVDPGTLRQEDVARYRELSRAAIAHVLQTTFAEWRRAGSPTAGALIWFLSDLAFGAGWGVLDPDGEPKSAWYALRECLQPVQVLITDEGVNGLMLQAINETARSAEATVSLRCLREGRVAVVAGALDLRLEPHGTMALPATDLIGAFFDFNHAFRFGPPSHDAVVLELTDAAGSTLSSDVYFPQRLSTERVELGLSAEIRLEDGVWHLLVSTGRLAQFVQIETHAHRPSQNWFHLAPDRPRSVRLAPIRDGAGPPSGHVRAANGLDAARFGAVAPIDHG